MDQFNKLRIFLNEKGKFILFYFWTSRADFYSPMSFVNKSALNVVRSQQYNEWLHNLSLTLSLTMLTVSGNKGTPVPIVLW